MSKDGNAPKPNIHPTSLELIYALNTIALSLQESIHTDENVFEIFRQQVISLGLRGGISELNDSGDRLIFRSVAYANPIGKLLGRFERQADTRAEGYAVDVDRVDVYREVTREGHAVFVPDTSHVSAQVVPDSLRGLVTPLLSFLGRPPGIFAPLIYEGKIKGMLNMVGSQLTAEDIPTMQAFANQIAVALENTRLVEKLQTANEQLEAAYEKTLEGWVQAIDLRDAVTEGHTMRTAEMTVRLARFMNLPEADIPHLRRGALLHDIGKMAIPDNILLKPGQLTDEEWRVMKQHPQTAYNWLASIDYLKPAVDIPLCHHEHWDGSGYGQGLKGEEIPFHARIFTVVDVWDAMRSDRPYRKAIPMDATLQFIRSEAGKLFDPHVVDAFLELRGQNPDLTG